MHGFWFDPPQMLRVDMRRDCEVCGEAQSTRRGSWCAGLGPEHALDNFPCQISLRWFRSANVSPAQLQENPTFWFPTDESEGEAIGTAQATALGRPKKTFRVLISLKGSLFDCRAKKSYYVRGFKSQP